MNEEIADILFPLAPVPYANTVKSGEDERRKTAHKPDGCERNSCCEGQQSKFGDIEEVAIFRRDLLGAKISNEFELRAALHPTPIWNRAPHRYLEGTEKQNE